MTTTKLTAPNGATVSVDSEKAESLLRRGFTKPTSETKAPAKKAASSTTQKS